MKNKVDKLDVDKIVPASVDLSKQSDVVKNVVVKKDVYDAKIKYLLLLTQLLTLLLMLKYMRLKAKYLLLLT